MATYIVICTKAWISQIYVRGYMHMRVGVYDMLRTFGATRCTPRHIYVSMTVITNPAWLRYYSEQKRHETARESEDGGTKESKRLREREGVRTRECVERNSREHLSTRWRVWCLCAGRTSR